MAQSYIYAGVAGYVGRPEAVGKVGVFRRSTAGGDWSHVLPDVETYTVNVHPADASVVLAGTKDGVYLSTDSGATFKQAAFPDKGMQIWSFQADSRNPARILAGGSPLNVYRSEDKGQSWKKMATPPVKNRCTGPFAHRVMRMVQHPTRTDEVYAALEIAGAMRSMNFGETWEDCSEHLAQLGDLPHLKSKIATESTQEGMLDGHAITISPADPDAVVIACRMGLFESRDKGKTWADKEMKKFSPITYGRDVKAAPQDATTMYCALSVAAASKDGGVYKSTDAGKTWKRFDKVQVHGTIMSVGLNVANPRQVIVGARYEGEIFRTEDGGETWSAIPLPGPVKDIYSVACS